jgi:hypothetical protein
MKIVRCPEQRESYPFAVGICEDTAPGPVEPRPPGPNDLRGTSHMAFCFSSAPAVSAQRGLSQRSSIEPEFDGQACQVGAAMTSGLIADAIQMGPHGGEADDKRLGDLLIGRA